MHRTLQISVPAANTDELCRQLVEIDEVVGLSVERDSSLKPPGDVVTAHVLNRGTDDVLRRVQKVCEDATYSIATSELASLISSPDHGRIIKDVDEAIWEEMETGLRHQARVTPNSIALFAFGGAIAAVGLVSEPVPQAIAFTAAAIIAPGFEPFAGIPLGIVLQNWRLVGRAVFAAIVGYTALTAAAALTFLLLRAADAVAVSELLGNKEVQSLAAPDLKSIIVPAFGAAAGIVMIAAYRRSVIAGPLIALITVPAAALVGASLAVAETSLAWAAFVRLATDVGLIVGFGLVIFWLKQQLVHARKPVV